MSKETSDTSFGGREAAKVDDEQFEKAASAPSSELGVEAGTDPFAVTTLDPDEDPKNMSRRRKWFYVLILSCGAHCTACVSAMGAFTETAMAAEFGVSQEVTTLGVSLFILGIGMGPPLFGPLSEVHGRNLMYRMAYFFFFAFSWPVAFPPNIGVFLAFRFLGGVCSSVVMTVSGGSFSDIFLKTEMAWPMAVWTWAPFVGPADGPMVSAFITQNTTWKWVYRVTLIWVFVQFLLILLLPETYVPTLLQRKATRLRKETGDNRYWAPLDRKTTNLLHATMISCYVPFQLMATDTMCLLIDIWGAIVLGLQYLALQAFPIIFEQIHGFTVQQTGLAFLGMGIGMCIALAFQPIFIRYTNRKIIEHNGDPPPEVYLVIGQVGAVILPISLYWLAFTTYPHVHWIWPELATGLFGVGILYSFTAIFTYLVTAYRPVAASAMASNSFMRGVSAAAFPLFARQMYHRMGTVGATAMLAGLTTVAAVLPFIFYRIGPRLRAKSRFTTK